MVINPIKGFLFAAGAAAAIVAIAWYAGSLDPYLPGERPVVAAVPDPGSPKGERVGEPDAAEAPTQAPAAAGEVVPPSFDIVRVEPGGSIVIAGKAARDAMVEILAGSQVVGSAKAGSEGDFAAILDEPLKPGDYQIVLRSTTPDNVVAASPETAIVSIPEQPDGQVLALVEQPGEPTRLITVPEPETPSQDAGGASEAAAVAEEEPDGAPSATSSGQDTQAPAPQPQPAPGAEVAETAPPAPGEEVASLPEPDAEVRPDAAAQASPPAPASETEADSAEMAAVAPDAGSAASPLPEAAPAEPAEAPEVAVEAVEIEGPQIFVAGVAEPGRTVRVYANDMLLGEATASPGGRFLVETQRELPVGDYIIRADVLNDNGAEVIARAAVPFEREEGESLAAIAPRIAAEAEILAEPAPVEEQQAAASATQPTREEPAASPPVAEAPSTAPATEPAEAAPAPEQQTPAESNVAAAPAEEPVGRAPEQEPSTSTAAPAADETVSEGADIAVSDPQSAPAPGDSESAQAGVADRPSQPATPHEEDAAVTAAEPVSPSAPADASPPALAEAPAVDPVPLAEEDVTISDTQPAPGDSESAQAGMADRSSQPATPDEDDAAVTAAEPVSPSAPADAPPPALAEAPAADPAAPAEEDVAAAGESGQNGTAQPAEERGEDDAAPAATTEQQMAAAPPAAEPPTVTAPKLQSVPSAVIIRRGDNLWRISRRVYGRGVRYSTIYLANQDQIRDPDIIYPGQVFSVPKRTEEGETADMDVIRERLTGVSGGVRRAQ